LSKDIYARSVAEKALKTAEAGGGPSTVAWTDVTGKPTTFTPSAHNQAFTTITGTATEAQIPTLSQSKITNLTTDLGGKVAKSSVSSITAIADPATATAQDVATKFNALIAALKA
jgi:hypothetical protein